jgi:hypothetical protein
MMYLLSKQADNLWIVFSPNERIKLGDTLKIDDVVVQVVEVQFADIPGVLQHILRKSLIPLENTTEEIQPEVQSIVGSLSDQKVALAKIRGRIVEIDSGGNKTKSFKTGISEFNLSRAKSKIEVMDENELFQLLDMNPDPQSNFAHTLSASAKPYTLPLDRLGITVVTGMKGSGKSYAAKKILLDLIKHRVLTIVFDVNGEYLNLWKKDLNQPNEFMPYIKVLSPRIHNAQGVELPLTIPLNEISYDDFAHFMTVQEGSPSYQHLMQFWKLWAGKQFDLNDLETYVKDANNVPNEAVRIALQGRVDTAKALGLFGPSSMNDLIKQLHESGGAMICNLSTATSWERRIIVEFTMRKLTQLGQRKEIRAVSLFLEEAQLYVEPPNMINILTRMRHVGVFPTFITNDPRTLPDEVFTLLDNMITFGFRNEAELKQLAKSGLIDTLDTDVLRNLENKQCLAVGKITSNYPLFLEIIPQSGVVMGGESRKLVP